MTTAMNTQEMYTLQTLQQELQQLASPVEKLQRLSELFAGKAAFSTSFSIEDQVITHFIATNNIDIDIFTLDTGRHFAETYKVHEQTLAKYNKRIDTYFPQTEAVEELVSQKGNFSFYESVANRLECCHIRKVEPLNRALSGRELWVTGLRAGQSAGRKSLTELEYDSSRDLFKFHPILEWELDEVWNFITENKVPYNELYDKGYPSIGCAPCTRPVKEGEDLRAGRWWWETSSKECGLHLPGRDDNNNEE